MRIFSLAMALVMMGSGATAATSKAGKPDKCGYTAQHASEREASGSSKQIKDAPMRLRAVNRIVDGCPVLVMADSGKAIEPPSSGNDGAKMSPVH